MSFAPHDPGSAKNQIGRALLRISDCVTNEDAPGAANQTRWLVVLAAPFLLDLKPEERAQLKIPSEDEVTSEADLLEKCFAIVEFLLPILAESNVYAYMAPDVESADEIALTGADAAEGGAEAGSS